MIGTQILANASSAIYHTRAMQQADEVARLAARSVAIPSIRNIQSNDTLATGESRDLRRLRDARNASPANGFGDIYSGQFVLSSAAFLQAFGYGDSTAGQEDVLAEGLGHRQYRTAQEEFEKTTSNDPALDVLDSEVVDFSSLQEILPPLPLNRRQAFGALGGAAVERDNRPLPNDFTLARTAYDKAVDFRARAFSSPPSINLLG